MALSAVANYAHLARIRSSERARMTRRISPESPVVPITRRRILIDALAGAGVVSALSNAAAGTSPIAVARADAIPPTGDVHDFDFLVGAWNGLNRRLKKRWVGSDDWDVFPGALRCESRLDHIVNIDEVNFSTKGWSGVTVRAFSLAKRQWFLYWINSKTGELFPPVVGGFEGDRGVFYGDDTDEGQPVKVVFRWTRHGADAAHWEQAFSRDGDQWETNWTCDFSRAKA